MFSTPKNSIHDFFTFKQDNFGKYLKQHANNDDLTTKQETDQNIQGGLMRDVTEYVERDEACGTKQKQRILARTSVR